MKKNLKLSIFSIVLFASMLIQAQSFQEALATSGGEPPKENLNGLTNERFETLVGNEFEWSKIMGVLYQFDDIRFGDRKIEGSILLFDKPQKNARIFLDSLVFRLDSINYNIKKDEFYAPLQNDSIFVFDFEYVKKIQVAGREFKSYRDPHSYTKKIFEVLVEDKKASFYKKHTVRFVEASPNPMVNRTKNKLKKNHSYYLSLEQNDLFPIHKSKSSLFRYLKKDKHPQLKAFISKNRLKLRKEEDIIKLLNYYNSLYK